MKHSSVIFLTVFLAGCGGETLFTDLDAPPVRHNMESRRHRSDSSPPIVDMIIKARSKAKSRRAGKGERKGAGTANRGNRSATKHTGSKAFIMFFVDTSNTMWHFLQTRAETVFQDFLEPFDPLNWTLMFTNTDTKVWFFNLNAKKGRAMNLENDGKILENRYLVKNDGPLSPLGHSIFIDTLRIHGRHEYIKPPWDKYSNEKDQDKYIQTCELPPYCAGGEEPLNALFHALLDRDNRREIRRAETVTAIILSDGNELSKVRANDVKAVFEEEYGSKPFRVYGIIMRPEEDTTCKKDWPGPNETAYGLHLSKMAEITGGVTVSLCEKSYVPLAERIVSDILN